jgi:hypothetical protein
MTVSDLLQRLPQLREFFPQPIVQEWLMVEYLKSRQQQRAATWNSLAAWRHETNLVSNVMDDFDDPIE